MASVNKVILVGNLGRDPELKYTPSGTAVCSVSLATTRNWKDQNGTWQDKTEWHRVKIWSKPAERAAELLKKGSQVYIEGRIEYREWEQDGQKKYMTEIICDRYYLLGKKEDSGYGGSSGGSSGRPANEEAPPDKDSGDNFADDDDLPF